MGRKSWDKELEMKNLWDLSIPVLKRALKSDTVNIYKKMEVAQFIFGKCVPREIKGEGFGGDVNLYNIINQLQGQSKDMDNTSLELDKTDGLYKR